VRNKSPTFQRFTERERERCKNIWIIAIRDWRSAFSVKMWLVNSVNFSYMCEQEKKIGNNENIQQFEVRGRLQIC
jgi:hypothetical protein